MSGISEQIIEQVHINTNDIAILKSNTKWLYKYGGVGGKGKNNQNNTTNDPVISININNIYTVSNSQSIPLNDGVGIYTINVNVSKANEKSYKVSGTYKIGSAQNKALMTKVVSFDAGYSVQYSINMTNNTDVSIIVDSGDGEFYKTISFKCITTPYSFNASFVKNNGNEWIKENNDFNLAEIKQEGLKIKLAYEFAIDCSAQYDISENFGLVENKIGDFDLSTSKEGYILFNIPVDSYNEINIGQYYFTANIKITPKDSSTIYYPPITQICFIIPNNLFLMAYTENQNNQLYYNITNSNYSIELKNEYIELITKQEEKTITEEEKIRLSEINQLIKFSTNGIIGIVLKAYYGSKTNKTFTLEQIQLTTEDNEIIDINADVTTIGEQTLNTIAINIQYTGQLKLSFKLRYLNDVKIFNYYIYCVDPISKLDWLPNHIDTTKIYQSFYRGGFVKGNFNYAGKTYVELSNNFTETKRLCDLSKQIDNVTKYDLLIHLGIQYNAINKTSKDKITGKLNESKIIDIYSKSESTNNSQHICIYQNKIEYNGSEAKIFIPKEHNFDKLDGSKYHLLTIHKHLITNSQFEIDIYIDGSLESTFGVYDDTNLFFNCIDCLPVNFAINLAEIIYVPRIAGTNHLYFDDVSISQYWYQYCNQFRNGVGFNSNYASILNTLYKISESQNLEENDYILTLEDITTISSEIECPVILLTIDCITQFSNKSFKSTWFTASGTNTDKVNVKEIKWSNGKENLSTINIDSNKFTWYIDIQGTSSKLRKVKNLTLFTESVGENKETTLLFSPNFKSISDNMTETEKNKIYKESFLPEEQFNLKADIVDSSHANNTSIGQFINENTTPYEDAKQNRAKYGSYIKNCLTGFPVLLFVQEIRKNELNEEYSTYYYYGIYNFDLGRESYFNLGYKDLSVFDEVNFDNGFITYEIPNGSNQLKSTLLVAEVLENNIVGQDNIGGKVYDFSQFNSQILFGDTVGDVTYEGMFGKLKFSNNLTGPQRIISKFIENVAKSGAACFKRLKKNFSENPYYGYEYGYSRSLENDNKESLNYVPNFVYQGARNNNENGYPIYFNKNNDLNNYFDKTKSSSHEDYISQIMNTICPYQGGDEDEPLKKVHLDYNSLVEYFVACMSFGLVDSVCKNMNIKTWTADGVNLDNIAKWYLAFYDMDSGLGKDNAGAETSYFAFTDYWKSNDIIIDSNNIIADIVTIYRDFFPRKLSSSDISGYDIPSSFLFAIAKYAKFMIEDVYWNENHFKTPQDLWATWRMKGGVLETANSFIDKYFNSHLNKIPEALISYNYRFKYIWQTNSGAFNNDELKSFHGRGSYEVLEWLRNRFHILDAYFNLCIGHDLITYYDLNGNDHNNVPGWYNIGGLSEIAPSNNLVINNVKANEDIIIYKSLFSNEMADNAAIKTSLSNFTLSIKAPELTPLIIYRKGLSDVKRYLLNDSSKTYKINITTEGNQDILLGGSSEWIELEGAEALINSKTLVCISNNLQSLTASSGICSNWAFTLPALKKLQLTSKDYSGEIKIGYDTNNNANLENLSSINISNSSIDLTINQSNISEIIANNINSNSLTISNSTNLNRIELTNSYISNINVNSSTAKIIDFDSFKFNGLTITDDGESEEGTFVNIVENPDYPISILNIGSIEKVSISNISNLQCLTFNNDKIKSLKIFNSHISSLSEIYIDNIGEEYQNSIYVETIYDEYDPTLISRQILHLEKLSNLEEISFEGTSGFTEIKLPVGREIKLLSFAFANTNLQYIDSDDDNLTLILCDDGSEENLDCGIFYNSRFTLKNASGRPDSTKLHFKVQNKLTSLKNIFAVDTRNIYAQPNIDYKQAAKFINELENKDKVISFENAFINQTNILAYFNSTNGNYYYNLDYTNEISNLITFAGYNNLQSIECMFDNTGIEFIDENIFKDINLNNEIISIMNFIDFKSIKYIHFNAFDPIKSKIERFLFNGSNQLSQIRFASNIKIYDNDNHIINDVTKKELQEVNIHNLLFDGNISKLKELCGFNITNDKSNFDGLFTSNEKSIKSIHNVFTKLHQLTSTNLLNFGYTKAVNLNKLGLTNLGEIQLYAAFICDLDLKIENINEDDLVDIANFISYSGSNNQFKSIQEKVPNEYKNSIFNFYKKIYTYTINDEIESGWNKVWRAMDISTINNLFDKCVIFTNEESDPVLYIPNVGTGENGKLINVTSANNLFSNAIVKNNGESVGFKLDKHSFENLPNLESAQYMFYKCTLNGKNSYPLLDSNIFVNNTVLTNMSHMFENVKINGNNKTYINGEPKETYYKVEINSSDIQNQIQGARNYELKSYISGATTAWPFIPKEFFGNKSNLEISSIFKNSDFEGYLPSGLMNNTHKYINSFIENCKILPQKIDGQENKYVFVPEGFINNNSSNDTIQDIFNFYLLVGSDNDDEKHLYYILENDSIGNNFKFNGLNLQISPNSMLTNYLDRNNEQININQKNIHINAYFDKTDVDHNEGITEEFLNNHLYNGSVFCNENISALYNGYILKKGTVLSKKINYTLLQTGFDKGISSKHVYIGLSERIILPLITFIVQNNENITETTFEQLYIFINNLLSKFDNPGIYYSDVKSLNTYILSTPFILNNLAPSQRIIINTNMIDSSNNDYTIIDTANGRLPNDNLRNVYNNYMISTNSWIPTNIPEIPEQNRWWVFNVSMYSNIEIQNNNNELIKILGKTIVDGEESIIELNEIYKFRSKEEVNLNNPTYSNNLKNGYFVKY